jgi:RNA polymerase sigma factor (sigma-70 family)
MQFDDILMLLQSKEDSSRKEGFDKLDKALSDHMINFFVFHGQVNHWEAEDIYHETVVKIIKGIDSLRDNKKFKPWCWQIARNTLMDHFRKLSKYDQALNETSIMDKIFEKGVEHPKKETETREECVSKGIQEFGKIMPDRAYVIQLMMEKVSMKTISERIGRPVGATKQYVSQSRKKVASFIKHCLEIEKE